MPSSLSRLVMIAVVLAVPCAVPAADWTGDIPNGTVWPGGQVQTVSGNIRVPPGATLTAQPGAIVKFNGGRGLTVEGRLDAQGTSGQPVIFTSYRDDSAGGDTNGNGPSVGERGDWAQIVFSPGSTGNTLNRVEVRYAGYYSWNPRTAVFVNAAPLTLTNSIIRHSGGDGLRISNGTPTVTGVTFSDNTWSAISMDTSSNPVVSTPTVTNNGTNGLTVDAGTITTNAAWDDPGIVYQTSGNVTVAAGNTLTVTPGQIVKLGTGHGLIVEGRLTATGTAVQPVVFTSYRDDSAGGDTNNNGATDGERGDWATIVFGPTSTGSSMDHVEARYGGYYSWNPRAAVLVNGGALTLTNSVIRHSGGDGVRVVGSNPVVADVTLTNNTWGAMSMDLASNPAISGVSLADNGTNGLTVDGGTITTDAFWNDPAIVYQTSGNVTVAAGKTLTVTPGQVVKLGTGHGLIVEGKLTATGTAVQPVVFTSYRDDSAGGDTNNNGATDGERGDWATIVLGPTSTGSSMDHVEVRYAGYYAWNPRAAVFVNGGALTLTNSVIRHSGGDGVRIVAGSPTIHQVAISNCTWSAMSMDLASSPTISAVFLSANQSNSIAMDGGTINASNAWDDPDIVYRATGNITVATGQTLTVAPGQIVKLDYGTGLAVEGTISAVGTQAQPIIFTSYRDDSAGGDTNNNDATAGENGDWGRITLGPASTGNVMSHVDLRYAGHYAWNPRAAVFVNGGPLTLTDSFVRSSGGDGLRIVTSNPTVSGVGISNCTWSAMSMDLASDPAISGVVLTGNQSNSIALDGGTITSDRSWDDPAIVYRATGILTVDSGKTLTVAPGQVVKFDYGSGLTVNGTLAANGTVAQPVVFTSYRDDSARGDTDNNGSTAGERGDWGRITLGTTSTGNVMNHVEVRYAGHYAWNPRVAVNANGGPLTLTNSIVRDSLGDGVLAEGGAQVELVNDLVVHSAWSGVAARSGATVSLVNCTVDDNQYGAWANAATLSLKNNLVTRSSAAGLHAEAAASFACTYNDVYSTSGTNYQGLTDQTGQNGNVSIDPLYLGPAVMAYGLQMRSPAIDAATSAGAPATDLLGNPRFDDPGVANTGGGATPYFDMGAIERQSGSDPINLVVTAVTVTPAQAEIGDPLTVTWTVTNAGLVAISGSWVDALFASTDTSWSLDDVRLTEETRTGPLAPGASYTVETTLKAPRGLPGQLSLIARTNYRRQLTESNLDDNDRPGSVEIVIPVIPLGGSLQAELTTTRPERYFQVIVPKSTLFNDDGTPKIVGDLAVGLADLDASGSNELHVSRDVFPTRQDAEAHAASGTPDQRTNLFLLGDGVFYVLAMGAWLPGGISSVELSSAIDPFAVSSFAPQTGGNAGPVTVAIHGSHFIPQTTARLVAPNLSTRPAQRVVFGSSSVIYATFDLTGLAPGGYRIGVAETFSGLVLTGDLGNPESIGGEVRDFAFDVTSSDTFTVTAGGAPDVKLVLTLPSRVRAGREFNYTLAYSNDGNLDAPAPLVVLTGSGDTALVDPDTGQTTRKPLLLLGTSDSGPAGVLRPGQSQTLALRGFGLSSAGSLMHVTASLATAGSGGPNFQAWLAALGENPGAPPWSDVLASLNQTFGTTWASFQNALAAQATATQDGGRTHSVRDLLNHVITAALGPTLRRQGTGRGLAPTAITPSTTPPEDRVTGTIRRGRTGKQVLGVAPGTGSWTHPDCSSLSILESNAVIKTTWAAFAARAFATLASSHVSAWYTAALTNQPEIVYDLGSTASNLFRSVSTGAFDFHAVHRDAVVKAKRMIVPEIGDPPVTPLPDIPDFDIPRCAVPDFAFSQGLTSATLTPWSTPDGQFSLAVGFGGMQGAAATAKNVLLFQEDSGTIHYEGTIRYAFVDRYEFDNNDASLGFFDRNFYVAEWCPSLWANDSWYAVAAGFDDKVIVEETFSGEFTPTNVQDTTNDAIKPPGTEAATGSSTIVASSDPNDKVGPAGTGAGNHVTGDSAFLYTVRFENDPLHATAPALKVVVEDHLDTHLDWSTFQLGSFAFGSTRITAPAGLREYATWVDTQNLDGTPLRVNISAGLDLNTGLITWVFESIDPATGGEPIDPDAGFLPPNDATHRGEGAVTFTVMPKPALPNGTAIRNQASIVFDQNPAIVTPVVLNVIGIGQSGDLNDDGQINVQDVFYLINNLFAGGPEPLGTADVNGDGGVNVQDVFYLINYLFAGGPAPV